MSNESIFEKARELGQMIKDSELYTQYQAAKAIKDADTELNADISEFNLRRMNLVNEMEKPDKDENHINEMNEQLHEIYHKIMDKPSMQAFSAAQQDITDILTQINNIFTYYIEGEEGCSPSKCAGCGGGCH